MQTVWPARSSGRWSTRPPSPFPHSSRSEEHTSNSSHGSTSYAVFCLKKKKAAGIVVPPGTLEPTLRRVGRDHARAELGALEACDLRRPTIAVGPGHDPDTRLQ